MRLDAEGVSRVERELFEGVGARCLLAEALPGKYQAYLRVTDDAGIRAVNLAQRGIDAATDVLSFPSAHFRHGTARENAARLRRELDPDTGHIHLGDVVISRERALAQALEYGHSSAREMGYLFAHAMLHLLGYDHETDAQRAAMRDMEEKIMRDAGLSRAIGRDALIALAREAMENAYVPYSGYRVGAAVLTGDGRAFSGCNVENASYGLAICAERNAITTAVAAGARSISAIAVAAEGSLPYPCGACRQFLREFAKDCPVYVVNHEKTIETTLQSLLPDSFGPESLLDHTPSEGEQR